MSAAELRQAAETLRKQASDATDGPWRVCAEGSEGSRIAPAAGEKRERTRFIGILNGRVQPEDGWNARYVATMHPGIGLALADALDAMADNGYLEADPECAAMLDLARIINGGAA